MSLVKFISTGVEIVEMWSVWCGCFHLVKNKNLKCCVHKALGK